jgi:F-box domain
MSSAVIDLTYDPMPRRRKGAVICLSDDDDAWTAEAAPPRKKPRHCTIVRPTLPADMWIEVLSRLSCYYDWVSARKVCSSWRHYAQLSDVKISVARRGFDPGNFKWVAGQILFWRIAKAEYRLIGVDIRCSRCTDLAKYSITEIFEKQSRPNVTSQYSYLAFFTLNTQSSRPYRILREIMRNEVGFLTGPFLGVGRYYTKTAMTNTAMFEFELYWLCLLTLIHKEKPRNGVPSRWSKNWKYEIPASSCDCSKI